MESTIQHAISLRKDGKHQEARNILKVLLQDDNYAAKAHLQIAWSFDNEGKEQEAVEHYRQSLLGRLTRDERFDALFGLASTYRCLGEYERSLSVFEQCIKEYDNSLAIQPFYAMCLHNVGRHNEAMSLLLELLVSTTNSKEILEYQRAISLYAKDLDKKW